MCSHHYMDRSITRQTYIACWCNHCRSGIPHACLEGLEGYSHCWIIYIFHRNTDLQDLWRPDDRGLKAKVQVPKLNGKRVGVFATRTPHRPNPIGQSCYYN